MNIDLQYRKYIMSHIIAMIEHMTHRHNKVLPIRLDIRFPHNEYLHDGLNLEIQNLTKNLSRHFSYHGVHMEYVAVREQSPTFRVHYHLFICVDGNKHDSAYSIFLVCRDIWARIIGKRLIEMGHAPSSIDFSALGGLVNYSKPIPALGLPAMEMIRRPSSLAQGDVLASQQQSFHCAKEIAIAHAAYLAKEFTKGNAVPGAREMLASQIPNEFKGGIDDPIRQALTARSQHLWRSS